jgi:hypothetical protein
VANRKFERAREEEEELAVRALNEALADVTDPAHLAKQKIKRVIDPDET